MKAPENYTISNFIPQEPVSDPRLSPDGSLIAFTYTEINYEEATVAPWSRQSIGSRHSYNK